MIRLKLVPAKHVYQAWTRKHLLALFVEPVRFSGHCQNIFLNLDDFYKTRQAKAYPLMGQYGVVPCHELELSEQ